MISWSKASLYYSITVIVQYSRIVTNFDQQDAIGEK
jgi:hypothetical protein